MVADLAALLATSPDGRTVDGLTRALHRHLADLQTRLEADADPLAGFDAEVAAHLPDLTRTLDAHFAELTDRDAALDPRERQQARARHRMRVQPFFLHAASVRWALDKPLGYPGDYRVVNHVFDPPTAPTTPLGALLAAWSHGIGPARSHRARRPWACERLRRLEAHHILSFACGPERVLRELVDDARPYDLTLCDADPRALAHAARHLRHATLTVRTIPLSAQRLIVRPDAAADLLVTPAIRHNHGFDAILVLGLLDYLGDALVPRLLAALVSLLRPGGELLLTNLHAHNPWRAYMEYVLDWTVAHRTLADFTRLTARADLELQALAPDPASGTNLFHAARRAP